MNNIIRKCIALTKDNCAHVYKILEKRNSKNFSRVINEMIERDKGDDYGRVKKNNGCY